VWSLSARAFVSTRRWCYSRDRHAPLTPQFLWWALLVDAHRLHPSKHCADYSQTSGRGNGAQFSPDGPPALTSDQYTQDFDEVKAIGDQFSTLRTAEQSRQAKSVASCDIFKRW
jgi:hypothetical protein